MKYVQEKTRSNVCNDVSKMEKTNFKADVELVQGVDS